MADPFSDRYWREEFQVVPADLDRIAAHIRKTSQAHDLTALARRVVRGRLRHGPETGVPAQPAWAEDPSVRLWDPAGEWNVGDHVIVARLVRRGVHEAFVGEVIEAGSFQGVKIQLDGIEEPATYQRAAPGSDNARRWHAKVREVVAEKRKSPDLEEQVEAILLARGERVASQLLSALRADERFVRLAGRWFLRELAALPTDAQLTALAWAMVALSEPQPTDALVSLMQPSLTPGDPGLFGLYLALRQRPDLFENADPGQRPRWVLAGPPPGPFTPRHAAYDPETYEVLCLPREPVSPETIQRLWDRGLLRAVL